MSETLNAADVKALPVGTRVILHGRDRRGLHTTLDCRICQSGKKKVLGYSTYYGTETKAIREYPNKYYTLG